MIPSLTEAQDRAKMPPLTERQEELTRRNMQFKAAGLPEKTAWNIAYGLHALEVGHDSFGTNKRLQTAIASLTDEQRRKIGITIKG